MKFLNRNPYDDIVLLQKRSDFFKYVGDNNEFNDINDIKLGDIVPGTGGYFSMPITVSFTANSKRAFLLLVDKLSMTSNKTNISLINEFFYYLWQEIKTSKSAEIKKLTQKYAQITGFADSSDLTDKAIAYHLNNWIFNDQENTLVDKAIIVATVKNIIACDGQSDEVCYYQFREKYRNIPTFGYLISTDSTDNPAENFKKFIHNLPPIFSIKSFTFDKVKSEGLADLRNVRYRGNITINVYGKDISDTEISEIAKVIGVHCFPDGQIMSADAAIQTVTTTIDKLSVLNKIDKSQSDDLRQIKTNLEKIKTAYETLTPYKKVIKLFETYRMLNEGGLCK
jgi:hypothetical protein